MTETDAAIDIKTGDTTTLTATLTDDEGDPIDLNTADVVTLYVDYPNSETLVVNTTPTIVDAAAGKVEYTFDPAETTRKGKHRSEFVVEIDADTVYSTPQTGFFSWLFHGTLDREASAAELEADPDASLTTLYSDELRANNGTVITAPDEIAAQGLLHKTHIEANETLEIPADYGTVIAGPLTGDGKITGDGRLKII